MKNKGRPLQGLRLVLWEGLMGIRLSSVLYLYASTAIIITTLIGLAHRVARVDISPAAQLVILAVVVGAQFAWARHFIQPDAEEALGHEGTAFESGDRERDGGEIVVLAAHLLDVKAQVSELAAAIRGLYRDVPNHESLHRLISETRQVAFLAQDLVRDQVSRLQSEVNEAHRSAGRANLDDLTEMIDRLEYRVESDFHEMLLMETSKIRREVQEWASITERRNDVFLQSAREHERRIEDGVLEIKRACRDLAEQLAERLDKFAQRRYTLHIAKEKIRDVIGLGDKTIRSIIEETGCTIEIDEDGLVVIVSPNESAARRAMQMVEHLTSSTTEAAEPGASLGGVVKQSDE